MRNRSFVLIGILLIISGGFIHANPANDQLVLAAQADNRAQVENALRNGANVNHLFNERTALMEAAMLGNIDMVRLLASQGGVNLNRQNAHGQTALMFAARHTNNVAIARFLIERGVNINFPDHQRKTPLMYAAENQNTAILDFLLREGASVGLTTIHGENALILAIRIGNDDAAIRLIQQPGINLHQRTTAGRSVFIYAVENQNFNIVRRLVERGYEVTRPDDSTGVPSFLWLIQHRSGSLNIIEYLLRTTNAIHSRDSLGRDAFWYARTHASGNARLHQLLNEHRR